MRRFFTPKLQLSLGLVSLTVSLVFIATSLGLLPNEDAVEIQNRGTTSTALAVQLAILASRNDLQAVNETIETVVARSPQVLSIGVRGADGKLVAGSEQHALQWREPPDGKSTPTHIQLPLYSDKAPAGRIEIAFRPLTSANAPFGVSWTLLYFVSFLAVTGFAGSYLVLTRALRELDPSRTIPKRVEAAFDSLAEGVLIIDRQEHVLLANRAFTQKILKSGELQLGFRADELQWLSLELTTIPSDELPWRAALREEQPVLGAGMSIRDAAGELHRLLVNVTCIVDGRGTARGAIVTFDDVTALQETNERLSASIQELRKAQRHISDQNSTLRYLASRDTLTGCLNRRTFFEEAEALLAGARAARRGFAFIMIDADHFKSINDRFGHAAGDRVLVGLAEHLNMCCQPPHLVGRYGGEEFCIALAGLSDVAVHHIAEQIRLSVSNVATWLPGGERVTVSIGIATLQHAPLTLSDLASRADQALYSAKRGGRNRVVLDRAAADRETTTSRTSLELRTPPLKRGGQG